MCPRRVLLPPHPKVSADGNGSPLCRTGICGKCWLLRNW